VFRRVAADFIIPPATDIGGRFAHPRNHADLTARRRFPTRQKFFSSADAALACRAREVARRTVTPAPERSGAGVTFGREARAR